MNGEGGPGEPGPGTGAEPGASTAGDAPSVGSLGEEAFRLLGALSGWASQHGLDVQEHAEDVVRHARDTARQVSEGFEEHLATGAQECTWCPLCRTVHAVRQVSPEVRTHLTAAAVSLVHAASALLGTTLGHHAQPTHDAPRPGAEGPGSRTAEAPGSERVQRIRLDDEPDPAE